MRLPVKVMHCNLVIPCTYVARLLCAGTWDALVKHSFWMSSYLALPHLVYTDLFILACLVEDRAVEFVEAVPRVQRLRVARQKMIRQSGRT